jgi:O-antigen/teichoic acid export membrane protein
MIGILTFIVTLIVLSVTFKLFSVDTYIGKIEKEYRGEKYTETETKVSGILKAVGTVIASIIIGFLNPYEVERVD